MKIYILDIQDGNGCRILSDFSRDVLLEKARDWFVAKHRFGDPATQSNVDFNMDELMDGQVVKFVDGQISLGESDLDVTGIVDVLEDAQHTLGKLIRLVRGPGMLTADMKQRAESSFLTSDSAIHLTVKKLKGQP